MLPWSALWGEESCSFYEPAKKARKVEDKLACDQCDYRCSSDAKLIIHKRTHTGEKPYACDQCDFRSAARGDLKKHKLSQQHRPLSVCEVCGYSTKSLFWFKKHKCNRCDFEGCSYVTKSLASLKRHKLTHTGDKPYACDFEGCDYRCNDSGAMIRHKRTHTGEKPYVCDFEGCDYRGSSAGRLQEHKRIHTGEKPYTCDVDGCNFRSKQISDIIRHKLIHTGEKPYKCDFEGCEFRCIHPMHLKRHKCRHTGYKPHVCDFEGCEYQFIERSHLIRHKRTHTAEGQQRQKRKETRVAKILSDNKIPFDREVHIEFSCFNTDGKFARLDFVIHQPERSLLFLLECDEDQHSWYDISCETRRMNDVVSAVLGKAEHICFIRYNPDAFSVDYVKQKVDRATREARLISFLRTHRQEKPFEVVYLNYTTVEGKPEFFYYEAFSEFRGIASFL